MVDLCPYCHHYPCSCGRSTTIPPTDHNSLPTLDPDEADVSDHPMPGHSLEPNGLLCPVCGKPQYKTFGGPTCINGHGGVPGIKPGTDAAKENGEEGTSASPSLPSLEQNNIPAQRKLIPIELWSKVLADVERMLKYRLSEKGCYSLISSHESYGVIAEELKEMLDAVTSHGPERGPKVRKELLDIAVAAVVGLGSFDVGGFQW